MPLPPKRQRRGMALAMTLVLLVVTIPLLLGLIGSVTRSTQGARWSRAHASVEDCAHAAVSESLHRLLETPAELLALGDPETSYVRWVEVPWTRDLVADPAGFEIHEVKIARLHQEGTAELSSGLLEVTVEMTGPRGDQRVRVWRVFSSQDEGGVRVVEVEGQDLLFERG